MALVTSGSLSDSYQKYFSKMLLERQLPILQMEQFAVKATLPRKNGKHQPWKQRASANPVHRDGLAEAVRFPRQAEHVARSHESF